MKRTEGTIVSAGFFQFDVRTDYIYNVESDLNFVNWRVEHNQFYNYNKINKSRAEKQAKNIKFL